MTKPNPLKGKPRGTRRDPLERAMEKVNKGGPIPDHCPDLGQCWVWTGATDGKGYGHLGAGGHRGATLKAYRLLYERVIGPIPEGMELDHLCRNPSCVNPAHLEPVTHRENMLRGDTPAARHAATTHCPYGHEYTPENTAVYGGSRFCRACSKRRSRERAERRRAEREAR